MKRSHLLLLVLGSLFSATAAAQGSDDCSAAQAISGDGAYNFLTGSATQDGLPNALCDAFGQDNIDNDVWFRWTAGASGLTTVTTCDATSVDTKLAAYNEGPCPATDILDCNDDDCALQSTISFNATVGQTYLLRVGTFPGAAGGAGQILVSTDGGTGGNDACAGAEPIGGEGVFSFDNSSATQDGLPDALCDAFGQDNIDSDVWFAWTATTTGTANVTTCGGTGVDTKLAAYNGTSCPTGTPLACNDDDCGLQSSISFPAVSGNVYLLRIGTFPGAAGGSGTFEVFMGAGDDGCENPSAGPDVIVGELIGIADFGSVGGVAGYSIGTTSCNVGSATLEWFASTNRHPVIGQNMYRVENGRIEQIGMSWLKHGFVALQGEVCCDCVDPGTGTVLGIGCSDPYSASLNGFQEGSGNTGGLGPRSEVNPFTGDFPFPYTTIGQGGNAAYKRIQVVNTDLDPSQHGSARYFGEGHYVTPDDSAAGNQLNNVSHREFVVGGFSGGSWNLSLTGPTQRTQPAIYAWRDIYPGVTLTEVQEAGDGLFIIGGHAIDEGGTWRYEYAVYNMNADRAAQAFSVPVPTGAAVTDLFFRDVDHHSGEPYATTDWTAQVGGGSVTWSTESFAQNPNANALRWGTLFSFGFRSTAPPQTVTATLSPFKPGGGTILTADVPAPSGKDCMVLNYCTTSSNSVGTGAIITSSGSTSVTTNDFTLNASGAPASQFGLFYYGAAQANVAFGNGVRCVGAGGIGTFRLNPAIPTNGSGESSRLVDFNNPPSATGTITAGSTWYFQFWYRDPADGGAGFNLSDGLSATFCP